MPSVQTAAGGILRNVGFGRLKRFLRSPFAWALLFLLRWSGRQAGVVLVYHRVGDPNETFADGKLVPSMGTRLFESQMAHLKRHYRVVPVSELRDAVARRRRWQRFPVAVTFDDDSPTHVRAAMPILRRLGVPATFFLSGASLNAPFAFWYERLQRAFDRGLVDQETLLAGSSASERTHAPMDIHELGEIIKSMPPQERDRAANLLARWLGDDPPDSGMRASDVRTLATEGFDIGFHTRDHYLLPTLDDARLAKALDQGRAELAAAAGTQLTMIAYPNGDADGRVATATRAAGYRLGFTDEGTPVVPDTDPMLIGRVAAPHGSVGELALLLARTLR